MTLKGRKSHYNIKLLRGYGVSITLKDSKIHLKDGIHDITGKSESESWYVPKLPYEKIVISGRGYISTEALSLLSKYNRNVILVDTFGKPITFCNPMMESLTATRYRMAQYDTFRDEAKRKYLQQQTVKAKIKSQCNFLKSVNSKIDTATWADFEYGDDPLPSEAKFARWYWSQYARLIPSKYEFESRNNSKIRISKNHATDIVNALLNYGYVVLAGEISKYVNGFGLDGYCGFYHKSNTGFQPLVYDLMEPFRWLVEFTVWKFCNNKRSSPKRHEFTHTKDGGIVMDSVLIRRFLDALERKFQSKRRHEFRHGAKTKDGKKAVQEITVTKITVQNLVDYCIDKQDY